MSTYAPKLVALAAVFFVAPALAGPVAMTKAAQHRDCPKKTAQATTTGRAQQVKGATTITLTDRVPDGSLFDLSWRRGFFTP